MEKIKEYKLVIIIVLAILAFVFYWFQLRPSQIKVGCNMLAIKSAHEEYCNENSFGGDFGLSNCINNPDRSDNKINIDTYNFTYKACLNKEGL
jgi:hypothetical protein